MAIPIELADWRNALRDELIARRLAVSQAERARWNETITRSLLEGFPVLHRMVIGFYWPYKAECDVRFAIRHLREDGATAALPVVVQKQAPLEFRKWWPGAPMTKGVFDLPIPDGTPVVRPQALLIPPIGFDARGYRLGYGGGYFDRTLVAMEPQPLKIGVGFELSRIETIRPQPHDIPMDFIVTEYGIHRVTPHTLELVDYVTAAALASLIAEERLDPARISQRAYLSPPCYAAECQADLAAGPTLPYERRAV